MFGLLNRTSRKICPVFVSTPLYNFCFEFEVVFVGFLIIAIFALNKQHSSMKQRDLILRRFNSFRFKQAAHEIVKYEPQYYDENGVYQKDEWTYYGDIGKEYEGRVVTMEDYLDVENRFIDITRTILETAGCTYITLGYVEVLGKRRSIEAMRRMGLKEGMRIRVEKIDSYLRMSLRGEAFIVFINSRKGVQFDFSEDVLYMHLYCRIPEEELRTIVETRGLYLDPRVKVIVL